MPGTELAQDSCWVGRGGPGRSPATHSLNRSALAARHTEVGGRAVLPQLWRHIKCPELLSANGRPALGEPGRGPDALAHSLEVRGFQLCGIFHRVGHHVPTVALVLTLQTERSVSLSVGRGASCSRQARWERPRARNPSSWRRDKTVFSVSCSPHGIRQLACSRWFDSGRAGAERGLGPCYRVS